ncbi:MAG: hypothetical protein M0037_09720 [Betaproteobacteria bacterium]|nr:hypothetical protein [Betaproteobacteria bacterium]
MAVLIMQLADSGEFVVTDQTPDGRRQQPVRGLLTAYVEHRLLMLTRAGYYMVPAEVGPGEFDMLDYALYGATA